MLIKTRQIKKKTFLYSFKIGKFFLECGVIAPKNPSPPAALNPSCYPRAGTPKSLKEYMLKSHGANSRIEGSWLKLEHPLAPHKPPQNPKPQTINP